MPLWSSRKKLERSICLGLVVAARQSRVGSKNPNLKILNFFASTWKFYNKSRTSFQILSPNTRKIISLNNTADQKLSSPIVILTSMLSICEVIPNTLFDRANRQTETPIHVLYEFFWVDSYSYFLLFCITLFCITMFKICTQLTGFFCELNAS